MARFQVRSSQQLLNLTMWLIFLVCAIFLMIFIADWLEKKQRGEIPGWRYFGGVLACIAIGLVIGGGFFLWQVRPNLDKPFPDWLGFGLAFALGLFLWFAPTFAIASDNERFVESPLQIVNESVGEEQIGFLGLLAILLVGTAFLRFNLPAWAGFLLLLPCWIVLFYLWAASNYLLAWALLRYKISKRRRRKGKPRKL